MSGFVLAQLALFNCCCEFTAKRMGKGIQTKAARDAKKTASKMETLSDGHGVRTKLRRDTMAGMKGVKAPKAQISFFYFVFGRELSWIHAI